MSQENRKIRNKGVRGQKLKPWLKANGGVNMLWLERTTRNLTDGNTNIPAYKIIEKITSLYGATFLRFVANMDASNLLKEYSESRSITEMLIKHGMSHELVNESLSPSLSERRI